MGEPGEGGGNGKVHSLTGPTPVSCLGPVARSQAASVASEFSTAPKTFCACGWW